MEIEYEATFINIDKEEIRKRLEKAGAVLVRPEYLQRRIPFDLPGEMGVKNKFVRVRDEGNRVTLSYKVFEGENIKDQKELCVEVGNFDDTVCLLESLGFKKKNYQESKRELWKLDDVEITIDTWPFLNPLVEIEGKSEEQVRNVSEKIGFDYSEALFCSILEIYEKEYGINSDEFHAVKNVVFNMDNPFKK